MISSKVISTDTQKNLTYSQIEPFSLSTCHGIVGRVDDRSELKAEVKRSI